MSKPITEYCPECERPLSDEALVAKQCPDCTASDHDGPLQTDDF